MSEKLNFEAIYQQLKQLYKEKKLSTYEANIFDFVSIIKQRSDLLTSGDISSLEDLLKRLPDDIKEISNQITIWYENHETIESLILALPQYPPAPRHPRGYSHQVTPKQFNQLIKIAVRQSKPSSESSTSSSQK